MLYNLINKANGKIVAHSIVFSTDLVTEEEILDARLDDAIDEGIIPDDIYVWKKATQKRGILI